MAGRWLSPDPHWGPSNMVYGDDPLNLSGHAYAPDVSAITQSSNLYAFCSNNPIKYADSTGNKPYVFNPAKQAFDASGSQERSEAFLRDYLTPEIETVTYEYADKDGKTQSISQQYISAGSVALLLIPEAKIFKGVKAAEAAKAASGANKITPAIQNSMNHIFGKTAHNFSGLLKSYGGDQFKAYNAIVNSAQKMVDAKKLTGTFDSVKNPLVVKVGNYTVHVGGKSLTVYLKLELLI